MKKMFAMVAGLLMILSGSIMASDIPEGRILDTAPKRFGDARNSYEVTFSAFPSTFISTVTASAYQLKRGPKTGYVNITVRNVANSETGKAVTTGLSGKSINLLGQQAGLDFVEINEGADAIYYLADFRFSHEEQLKFDIEVKPEGYKGNYRFNFRQTFYEDGK